MRFNKKQRSDKNLRYIWRSSEFMEKIRYSGTRKPVKISKCYKV